MSGGDGVLCGGVFSIGRFFSYILLNPGLFALNSYCNCQKSMKKVTEHIKCKLTWSEKHNVSLVASCLVSLLKKQVLLLFSCRKKLIQ